MRLDSRARMTPNYICRGKDFLDIGYWAGNKEIGFQCFSQAHEEIMSGSMGGQTPKLLDQMREVLRLHRYALRTEQAYCEKGKRKGRRMKLRR